MLFEDLDKIKKLHGEESPPLLPQTKPSDGSVSSKGSLKVPHSSEESIPPLASLLLQELRTGSPKENLRPVPSVNDPAEMGEVGHKLPASDLNVVPTEEAMSTAENIISKCALDEIPERSSTEPMAGNILLQAPRSGSPKQNLRVVPNTSDHTEGREGKTFSGVQFALVGFNPVDGNGNTIRSKLVSDGGVDVGQYSQTLTHLIVDKLVVYDDPVCVSARSSGKVVVTGLWVDHSYDAGMLVDANSVLYRPLRDLNGIPGSKSLVVCLTGYHPQDREDIMTMVGLMGGEFSRALVADQVTHLICYKFEGDKYEHAKRTKTIKLVNHRWLTDCLEDWKLLPEVEYEISDYDLEMLDAFARDSDDEAEDAVEAMVSTDAVAAQQHNHQGASKFQNTSNYASPVPVNKTSERGTGRVETDDSTSINMSIRRRSSLATFSRKTLQRSPETSTLGNESSGQNSTLRIDDRTLKASSAFDISASKSGSSVERTILFEDLDKIKKLHGEESIPPLASLLLQELRTGSPKENLRPVPSVNDPAEMGEVGHKLPASDLNVVPTEEAMSTAENIISKCALDEIPERSSTEPMAGNILLQAPRSGSPKQNLRVVPNTSDHTEGREGKTFSGVQFALVGFNPVDGNGNTIRSKLVSDGGVDVGQYSQTLTHLIVDKLVVYDDPVCVSARSSGKVVVTGLWVDHSYDAGMLVDANSVLYRPLRDLNGIPGSKSLVVCLTGYHPQDREDIMTMVGLMGGEFSRALVADQVTHLICYKFEGDKYEHAKRTKTIKLVNHRWLTDCLEDWKLLPEVEYEISDYDLEMLDAFARDSDDEAEDACT